MSNYTPGTLKAYTYVSMTDINGVTIRRRVSLGTDRCTPLENAKDTMQRVRDNNEKFDVYGEFRINL